MHYVYLIQSGEGIDRPIKIGVSSNINKRLEAIQVGNPDKVHLIAKMETDGEAHAYWLEKNLHKFFSSDRIRGEWFSKINMKKFEKICASRPIEKASIKERRAEKKDIEDCSLSLKER